MANLLPIIRLSGSGQLFVFQHRRFNQLHQRIAEQVRIGTIVEPEGHFIKIGGQMLCRDFMPRSNDAMLEQGECGFNGVGMNVSRHVHLGLVPGAPGLVRRGPPRRKTWD